VAWPDDAIIAGFPERISNARPAIGLTASQKSAASFWIARSHFRDSARELRPAAI